MLILHHRIIGEVIYTLRNSGFEIHNVLFKVIIISFLTTTILMTAATILSNEFNHVVIDPIKFNHVVFGSIKFNHVTIH